MVILILAANSSFNGFPRLALILARDSYMPHQMSMMGDRLVFSNGVIILGVFSCLLIVLFNGDTHALILLYAVGVFLSFTISQAGMVKRWLVKKGPHWEKKLLVNGIGLFLVQLLEASCCILSAVFCILAGSNFRHFRHFSAL